MGGALTSRWGTSLLAFALIAAVIASGAAIAYAQYFITISSRTNIKEPLLVGKVREFEAWIWPGETNTMQFRIKNLANYTYLVNCTVTLPSPEDKVGDGHGIDVVEFTVGSSDETEDLRDDGVAQFAIKGNEEVIATLTIKAMGDAVPGVFDIAVSLERTVKLDDPPKYVHLSWSENDVYHTMTVMWWTEFEESGSYVVYDTEPHNATSEYAYMVEGSAHKVCYGAHCFPGYWHEVELTGLQPGTTYYFRVGGPGGWSREWKFRTIGLDENVKFVIGGDSRRPWGEGYELKIHPTSISNWPWARDWVTKAAASEDPAFVLFIGDLVESGNVWEDWANWFEGMEENLVTSDGRMIPIVAIIGNHEMGSYPNVESTYDWFKGMFANPGNELWYSLDFPNLHITVLATTGGCVGTWWEPAVPEAEAQVEWLKNDLASSDAKWKIVAFHVPWYTCFESGTGYTSEVYLKYWAQIIEDPAYGVDLVFSGHVHNYMRTWPLRTVEIKEVSVDKPWTKVGYKAVYELKGNSEEGITYVVSGTWGAPTDPYVKGEPCQIRDFMASVAARPSYVVLELTPDGGLHYLAKDTSGKVIDEVTFPYTTEEFPTPGYCYAE